MSTVYLARASGMWRLFVWAAVRLSLSGRLCGLCVHTVGQSINIIVTKMDRYLVKTDAIALVHVRDLSTSLRVCGCVWLLLSSLRERERECVCV